MVSGYRKSWTSEKGEKASYPGLDLRDKGSKEKLMETSILIAGDVHGEFGVLNQLISRRGPKILLQCGDFGFWPNIVGSQPKVGACQVYWCDGNHEDHWNLRNRQTNELWPNVFYQPRGSTLTLPDGRIVLFMGGAASIDKNSRLLGRDWFPEEVISFGDLVTLDPLSRVDIVISHTCPIELASQMADLGKVSDNDPTRAILSEVFQMYHPSLWYYGHWHQYKVTMYQGCRFCALDCVQNNGKWWEALS